MIKLLLAGLVALAALPLVAAEKNPAPALAWVTLAPAPEKPKPQSWWSDFAIAPFGAVAHPNFQGKPAWAAGVDLGYFVNRTVSIHVANLAYEADHWSGPAIDESSLLTRADLIRHPRERFVAYFLGGADWSWAEEAAGMGAGGGVELRLSRRFSLGADARVRAWFNGPVTHDVLSRAFLTLRW